MVQAEAVSTLDRTMGALAQGQEPAHLRSLLEVTDYRGSDVRLLSSTLLDGSRQLLPCPAP
eukprot:7611296-Pyramimonas_sp.AAC.1